MEDEQSLPLKDDLAIYNIDIPDLPKDLMFPDEINRYLRDRIKYLTHENGMLEKNLQTITAQLETTEFQMKSLEMQLKKYQSNSNNNVYVPSIELANTRISELSKKLREKTSEMESHKTKCAKLQKRLIELESDDDKKPSSDLVKASNGPNQQEKKSDAEQTIKALRDKVNSVSSKLFETKNANTQLRNDMKAANKLLQQEVGESFETLQSNNGNWRGRAQIICDLQEKNNELREKLKMYQDKGHVPKRVETHAASKNDAKLTCLMQENQNLTQELQEVKRKLETTRSRCKYLDTELIVTKTKLKAINEQNERDNDRITSLTAQMGQIQNGQNENVKSMQKQLQKTESIVKSLKTELSKENCLNENLRKELANKEAVIDELKRELDCGHSPSVSYEKQKIKDKEISRLEAERLRLLELVDVCNKRSEEERNAHNATQIKYLQERQKAAKLEARIARLQLEQQSQHQETDRYSGSYYSNSSQSSFLKTSRNNWQHSRRDESLLDRLEIAEENIKALMTRLSIEKRERATDFNEFKKILLEREKEDAGVKDLSEEIKD